MATIDDDSIPIEVDSNGDEEVAEIDSMPIQKTATVQAGTYKPVVDGKPLKRQRKLTSNVWEHYEFLQPSEDGAKGPGSDITYLLALANTRFFRSTDEDAYGVMTSQEGVMLLCAFWGANLASMILPASPCCKELALPGGVSSDSAGLKGYIYVLVRVRTLG
ncbi:hypothetical protein Cgig2_002554 [Carnegiea gigantea]|uniref:Uncharacterized protein n=1 Tax=Carnegiea gigantea TaxID=171969 RepID=A0A9Q1JL85_9CARY|nr:hypothetical protein Cgig2_002554 [Carnegiea gigantea]